MSKTMLSLTKTFSKYTLNISYKIAENVYKTTIKNHQNIVLPFSKVYTWSINSLYQSYNFAKRLHKILNEKELELVLLQNKNMVKQHKQYNKRTLKVI